MDTPLWRLLWQGICFILHDRFFALPDFLACPDFRFQFDYERVKPNGAVLGIYQHNHAIDGIYFPGAEGIDSNGTRTSIVNYGSLGLYAMSLLSPFDDQALTFVSPYL